MISHTETIKERLSIVDVVGSYIKLERAGKYMRARCPFHNEKTPSFVVSQERNTYHCFGCGKGGDIFSFVSEIEGIPFYDALKTLAQKANVELTPETSISKEHKNHVTVLYEVMEDSAKLYEYLLTKSPDVIKYLHGRGLTDETIKKFRIGFAPNQKSLLTKYLVERKKYKLADLKDAGLTVETRIGTLDRFRGRIMFPICNSSGKVVAYSGRIYEKEGELKSELAKYINSPETELYNKSKILFGYDKAKSQILKDKFAIIVEGQFDLVMAHQAGNTNTVAVSGTALTPEHLNLIKRFTDNLHFAFDSDKAGVAASERAYHSSISLGMNVKMISIDSGKDPADLISSDIAKWENAIQNAKNIIEYKMEIIKNNYQTILDIRKAVSSEIIPLITLIKKPIEKAHYVEFVAREIGINQDVINKEINEYEKSNINNLNNSVNDLTKEYFEKVINNFEENSIKKIASLVFYLESEKVDIENIKQSLNEDQGGGIDKLLKNFENENRNDLILQAEYEYEDTKNAKLGLVEILSSYKKYLYEKRIKELSDIMREKENKGEDGREILKQISEISIKVQSLKDN